MNLPSASAPSRPAYRRRLHYVDGSIQRSLMVAMVALEVVLVAASIGLAYLRLNGLIEDSMYRVHLAEGTPILMRLAAEGFAILGLFTLVNVIALLVAQGIWSRHENLVLQGFTSLIGKTQELDFSSDPDTCKQHEVLALAMAWRARERSRFSAIRDQVARLEVAASAKTSKQDMRILIAGLNKLLS